jgi:protein PsiE
MSEHLDAHRAIKADSPPTESEGPMLETTRRVVAAASHVHRDLKGTADAVGTLLVDAFHLLALFLIGATTVWSAAAAFIGMIAQGHASLGDILLLFIYLEIGAMVGIYFKTTRLPVRYLMYIAITALGRVLIEIVGAEHQTGRDILVTRAQYCCCHSPCSCSGSGRTDFRRIARRPIRPRNNRLEQSEPWSKWTRTQRKSLPPPRHG